MAHILIVDDERSICEMLDIALRKQGHQVETVTSATDGRRKLEGAIFDLVITDLRLSPTENGLDLLRFARELDSESAFVFITGHGSMETAIEAIKIGGVVDYIIKTPDLVDRVRYTVERALAYQRIGRENTTLKRELKSRNASALASLIGNSASVQQLKETIRTVAAASSTVLIRGESGTGKELVARGIHSCSNRSDLPFISVNCGAFPETLLESELFGYVKGAFTGANSNRRGLIEAAEGGTLFLDEIGEMTLPMQVSLLRVLQERQVRPLGSSQQIPVDARLLAATNANLEKAVRAGTFREDLYYRISVIPIELPPLRERREDIPLLAQHFLRRFAEEMRKPVKQIADESLRRMEAYEWPGNVRQLENVVERGVALAQGETVTIGPLSEKLTGAAANNSGEALPALPPDGLERLIEGIERHYLATALQQSGGVRTKAADLLRMSYRSFRHYAKKYGI